MRVYKNIRLLTFGTICLGLFLQSCGLNNTKGQLVGVKGRMIWNHPQPFGTVNIPTGTYHMGQSDQDIIYALTSRPMQVTVQSFFMDDTEITNNEYRQFVHWVRDSMARKMLGDEYVLENDNGDEYINWKTKLRYSDPEVKENITEMFYQGDDIFEGDIYEFDIRGFKYDYHWMDLHEASKRIYYEDTRKGNAPSRSTFRRDEMVPVYPDTLCWIRDFTYSFNDPLTQLYFYHPGYDDYPVVGVSWKQAKAFAHWRTKYLNDYYKSIGMPKVNEFRLPTEAEWEYAARGGRDFNPYPWGGPYLRNSKGCFLANFKPLRGNYSEDGGYYPVKVTSYFPNDYGLYCMAGNVSEWTDNAYNEGINAVIDDMNPFYYYDASEDDNGSMKRKSIRGGSYKDVGYWLQNGTRTFEYQDTAKAYVGFRCVMTYMGRSIKDKNSNY
ncbi:MAG: SUMF1/EgtB/PvdO family nonheme iron enzyme [Bacteroidetes bacterium]|jgi:formylglycine-generating enzyme|nr:SUMF1/EgtB/PvdO family nonheme iron enzyme [Bacteroidota bacterium]MBT5528053.1 SUMF1/EgtB/PvdO family nonheme iron enzyme [Cytophagia bacterium]MBT3424347.1 SUMF1/EgtB/PvdO family nonheme iron enzyme [Bacteroidota bacterium]MBT3799574.1 SUMF1/EgtB/PvdO family nonheme iron enzyme [Bacteroidota bacterium]MBT3934202.1 SUMF1/EgtB/PvdO family nonheme iron enzyme [Bacteroidota bacterium]